MGNLVINCDAMKTLFISMLKGAIIGVIGAFLMVQLLGLILPEIKKPPPDPEKKSQLSDEILSYILDLRIENVYISYVQARG